MSETGCCGFHRQLFSSQVWFSPALLHIDATIISKKIKSVELLQYFAGSKPVLQFNFNHAAICFDSLNLSSTFF